MARRPLEAFGLYLSSKNTDDVLQELAPTPYMTDGRVSFISLRKREVLPTTETCNKCLLLWIWERVNRLGWKSFVLRLRVAHSNLSRAVYVRECTPHAHSASVGLGSLSIGFAHIVCT